MRETESSQNKTALDVPRLCKSVFHNLYGCLHLGDPNKKIFKAAVHIFFTLANKIFIYVNEFKRHHLQVHKISNNTTPTILFLTVIQHDIYFYATFFQAISDTFEVCYFKKMDTRTGNGLRDKNKRPLRNKRYNRYSFKNSFRKPIF
ncbi:unnamed protein product [Diabrotica balteata]|uniref:Uncharacterized protein n=1 Tax=Diabrotica balteata TaxID=107213 RepID=A0A9N9T2K8_DIABA|nr:unnamed protein product [Diabrotica balteata]